ncbi:uncharacterized protein JCM6883_003596 [Sporobolomyces salmoneus]|uniref:uncharacterized protein n=1 Tax=Sporobolomyces salmoneus TaxID=183962 RepID=UPI003173CFCF
MSFSTSPGYRPGHFWLEERHSSNFIYSRRLGTLEQRFDIGSRSSGQSDTFVKLRLHLSSTGEGDSLDRTGCLSRLLLAWTRLRAKHPLLAATIHEDEGSSMPGCPARRFEYRPPSTPDEAVRLAQQSMLLARGEKLDDRIREIQRKYVLNGERVLLEETGCLARLILVEGESERNEMGFFLVISHVISDGLSVLSLVNELFATASSSQFLSPSGAPTILDFDSFVGGSRGVEPWSLSPELHKSWKTTLSRDEVVASLPLATEDHLPPLPLESTTSTALIQPTEAPTDLHGAEKILHSPTTTARKRWCWAISRTIILARQRRTPHTLPFPRLENASPPPKINTDWQFIRFDRTTTEKLIQFCKLNGQSPSMLLYSMIALATSNLFSSVHPSNPYHPILIGFPFSARPLLEKSTHPSSDPSSDLAIRLTFTSIALPNFPLSLEKANSARVQTAILRGARLAKSQLSERLANDKVNRTISLHGVDGINTDRLLLRYEQPRPPWEDPKTCINGSMIGDIDRILQRGFSFSSNGFDLRLSDLEIGTRLHTGEGMFYEGFTFEGCLQLSGGYDKQLIDSRHFWSILNGVKEIGQLIAGE